MEDGNILDLSVWEEYLRRSLMDDEFCRSLNVAVKIGFIFEKIIEAEKNACKNRR